MPEDPICPNDELDRLRSIIDEGTPERIGKHTLRAVGIILGRVRDAQAEGRVLPDPNDPGLWKQITRDQLEMDVARVMKQFTQGR